MESRFHCQKTKAGEKCFCVLEKMRVTISNHDICKKNNLKGYRKWSSKKGLRTSPTKSEYESILKSVGF
jgi:hypothetical protein